MSKPFLPGRRAKARGLASTALFTVGDAVRDPDTREVGHVAELGADGQMSIVWLASGSREWCHQDLLVWAPDVPRRE